MITLHEYNGFNNKLIKDLRTLVDCCKAVDGYTPMIYWEVLKLKREVPGDYCLYQDDTMVGYLSTFNFEDYSIEVSFAIHPDFRNQSLFEHLLDYARDKLQLLYYDALILSTDVRDHQLAKTFNRLGAEATHKEYMLKRDNAGPEDPSALDSIELVQIKDKENAVQLAQIHERAFHSDLEMMIERFSKTVTMPNRRCFIALHHGEAIGALHARIDGPDSTCLHDIGIVPEKRNAGFGAQLVKLALNTLMAEGQHCFELVVATNNHHALKLYQRCGFILQQTYQFWRIDKYFSFPPHYTIPERRH